MIELALNNVVKYFGATEVLMDITFEIQESEKVGIVGGNGSGKSTVLKIIAGIEQADKGAIMLKKGSTLGYLDQIPIYPKEYTVLDVLNVAFRDLEIIEEEMKSLEKKMVEFKDSDLSKALKQYSILQQKYEILGGYEKEEKLSKVCIGMDFTPQFLTQAFDTLSGGEKTTIILGKILLENPDLLLLDEPTNHLDVKTVEWLEEYLKNYKGMVLIVSHDRYFLDKVVTKIIEIEDMESDTYIGNYTEYVKEKENRLALEFEAYQEQEKKIKAMEKAIKELRDWAIRADNNKFFRRAASMQKRLDKIQKLDRPVLERQNMKLNIQNSERSGGDVIKIKGLVKSFENKVLFNEADLLIRFGEKVALIGGNGTGKTTLLKILLGEEIEEAGTASLGSNIRSGYLPQQVVFQDEDMTVLECFRDGITISEGKAREYLAKFLFMGNSVFKKVKSLSGGEKSRLKLSRLLFEDINLLILDEPTNHLDIDSIETLEETLLLFEGTILFISHDRYFINKLCSKIVALENQKLTNFLGNYEYYRQKRNEIIQIEEVKPREKKEKPEKT
ncbi:MAG: ABC-F family ATP-binding cassette domain-containing protein, partial [Clostridiaceae bacterium]|nr:ABC-F family ATP-binding cassette domain-containing protein [Clostridiaceae bacterium]